VCFDVTHPLPNSGTTTLLRLISLTNESGGVCVHISEPIITIQNYKQLQPMLIKIQPDATVCRYLFTAKFRVSQHPTSGVLKTITAVSGTGHNTGTATSLQRGLIKTKPDTKKLFFSIWFRFVLFY